MWDELTLRALSAGMALAISVVLAAFSFHAALEKPPDVHSVQDAAAIRVTTLSVARWEDYVDAFKAAVRGSEVARQAQLER